MAKGRAVHALLQHLPDIAPQARRSAALRFIGAQEELAEQAEAVCNAVLAILDDPALAGLFGPGSRAEIPLAGIIGDVEIGGLVDRLAVTEDCVTLADFKTDRAPPAQVAEIPVGYLRQLAAYRAYSGGNLPGAPHRLPADLDRDRHGDGDTAGFALSPKPRALSGPLSPPRLHQPLRNLS